MGRAYDAPGSPPGIGTPIGRGQRVDYSAAVKESINENGGIETRSINLTFRVWKRIN